MAEFSNVDAFLNFQGSERGGGTKKLKKWIDRGFCNAFFHTKMLPTSVWYHSFFELVVRTDRETDRTLKNVWFRQNVCLEDEAILKKQHFRTPEGHREHPPVLCPDCITIEVVRGMIKRGEIKDTDVLFEFSGADKPDEDRVLHAGGYAGLWTRKMSEPEKARLAQHGIYMGNSGMKMGAWSENAKATLSYIFAMVDADNVGDGLLVAIQKQSLGDKVKKTINKEIKSNGDLGNPFLHPYCLQFTYDEKNPKFDDKYDAARMNSVVLTPQIEALIRGERPDISRHTTPPDLATHRSLLEAHCRIRLPWGEIFKKAEEAAERKREAEEAGGLQFDTANKTTQVQVPANVAPPAPAPTPAPVALAPAGQKWGDPCDSCKAPMLEGALVCGACGMTYDEIPDPASPAATSTQTSTDGIPF